ncbi:hypothetical protein [Sulfobacillus harzensis]|uniref:hypothetical protein n=1 Tax=Sulfobacillus harzensis TaxID=2729629 RepID=UPI001FAC9296|nr:hypothetical protein [Sulfobacillus harzensis]
MNPITRKVLPKNFASGPPFPVSNGWRPEPVTVTAVSPPGADVIAAALPMAGGMRVVIYNREPFPVEVTFIPVVPAPPSWSA